MSLLTTSLKQGTFTRSVSLWSTCKHTYAHVYTFICICIEHTYVHTIHVVYIELFLSKVETIGDTYMLVAGLPNRLHLTHAEVVARSALALLSASLDFTIPHMPEARLQLRIGLHSGTVQILL